MQNGTIASINISEKTGLVKKPVPKVFIDQTGIKGDAHAGQWHRQISILDKENIDKFNRENNFQAKPGDFAENLTTCGLDLEKVNLLDRLQIGEVVLEVTQRGKVCHNKNCAVSKATGKCIMPKKGIFAQVLHGGEIKADDGIIHEPRSLKILIITLSDRATQGIYADRTGPLAKAQIAEFFAQTAWRWQINTLLLSDDPEKLEKHLLKAIKEQTDIIFTLGGTGLGQRDLAPETVVKFCDKLIPGIMENVRVKYGSLKPNALLSRSIAGVTKKTQLYTLPGSTRAVKEYLDEILPLLEHAIFMLHGIDSH